MPYTLKNLNEEFPKAEDEDDSIHYRKMSEDYIKEEMIRILEYDNINYPLKGTKV